MAATNDNILPVLGKIELLKRSPYFFGFSSGEYLLIGELAIEERFVRDAIVVSEGDDNNKLYLVASGAAKLFGTSAEGKEQIIALARLGESFNDVAAFDGGTAQTGVQALTPLVVYSISGKALLERSCSFGPLAANMVRALAARVRALGRLVSDLSFRPVSGRLAKILLEQLGYPQTPRLTQRDMAAMAGTAREVVARALKGLEDAGMIRLEKHRITILDHEGLKDLAL